MMTEPLPKLKYLSTYNSLNNRQRKYRQTTELPTRANKSKQSSFHFIALSIYEQI